MRAPSVRLAAHREGRRGGAAPFSVPLWLCVGQKSYPRVHSRARSVRSAFFTKSRLRRAGKWDTLLHVLPIAGKKGERLNMKKTMVVLMLTPMMALATTWQYVGKSVVDFRSPAVVALGARAETETAGGYT